jgi:hypothetical protein
MAKPLLAPAIDDRSAGRAKLHIEKAKTGAETSALFIWLSRKTGLAVGLASLAVFAVSVALYRWFEWLAWGGLVLIVLAVGALGYGLYRNRRAFATLVQGGQDVKAAFAEGVQYTRDEIRRLFNKVHAAAQAGAGGGVEEMVQDAKGKE